MKKLSRLGNKGTKMIYFDRIRKYLKNNYFFLLGVFLIGLLIKIFLWNLTPYVSRDSIFYIEQIQIWHDFGSEFFFEESEGAHFPPLFFYLSKGVMNLGITALNAGLTINIFLSSLISIIVYFIAKDFTDDNKIAMVSSIFALCHPSINRLAVEVQRDTGYLFFSTLVIWMTVREYTHKKLWYWCLGGCFTACAFLFRVEALEFIPITVFTLFGVTFFKYKKNFPLWNLNIIYSLKFVSVYLISYFIIIFSFGYIMGMKKTNYMNLYKYYLNRADVQIERM